MPNFNKTIQLFIFEGNPNGRIMCELSNWNGRVYKIARNQLSEFSQRTDSTYTGVYFLFGKDENNATTIYIGEAENIITRLKQHLNDDVYWNECVIVISNNDSLNKAHVKFLENKFYLLAKDANRSKIINGTIPTCSSVSEYDQAMLEEFIDNAKLLVATLGYKSFETIEPQVEETIKFYISATRGADAVGTIVSDGFLVFKGSTVASSTTSSMSENLKNFRAKLYADGIIDSNNKFVEDYLFSSPSYAVAIVMGRNANGKTEWKTTDRQNIHDIESQ